MIRVESAWLSKLLCFMEDPPSGCLGPNQHRSAYEYSLSYEIWGGQPNSSGTAGSYGQVGLVDSAQPVDSAAIQKYESIFIEPHSESKHEAFMVLFQDDAFLADFAQRLTRFWPNHVKDSCRLLDCAWPERPSATLGG
jgi:hypothetical protein